MPGMEFFQAGKSLGFFCCWYGLNHFITPQIFGKMNNLPSRLTLGSSNMSTFEAFGVDHIASHCINDTKREFSKDKCLLLSYMI